jgi:hypothetical protein
VKFAPDQVVAQYLITLNAAALTLERRAWRRW